MEFPKNWDLTKDTFKGTDVYGKEDVDAETAWSIQFDNLDFEEVKVESGNTDYSKVHTKKDFYNIGKDEEFVKNKERMDRNGGVKVYIKQRFAEVKLMKFDVENSKVIEGGKNERLIYNGQDIPHYGLFFQDSSLDNHCTLRG